MSKQTGLGDQLFYQGVDIGGDIQSIGSLSTPRTTLDATGITKSAMERLPGTTSGLAEFTSFFNKAAGAEHLTLRGLPNTDVQLSYLRGTTLGNQGVALIAKQVSYDGTRGDDGSFTFSVSAQSNGYTAEWGKQLTAGKRTDVTATNGSSVDFGSGSLSFGFQAYLQVFSFTGTSITIKLQESSDNGAGDAFADVSGGAFTAVTTAPGVQRIASATTTQTVERYLRVVTTGTFSNCQFAVLVVRNAATRVI